MSTPSLRRRGVPLALEVGEHEELVPDDRGADAESERVVPHLAQRQFAAVVLVALELVALGVEVGRDLQVVGSRLGDGVDRSARESALAHVEGGYRHRHLLQRVERNGRTACGQVAADAEHVRGNAGSRRMVTPSGSSAVNRDVALSDKQRKLAREYGMSYREYYELINGIPSKSYK